MASKQSFFLTGANAKIILDGKTVAFATDISFSITVSHATPRVLGRFEVEVVQPLSYDVSGSLSIIKYARALKSAIGGKSPKDINELGNGVGSYGPDGGGLIAQALGLPVSGASGSANESFVPSKFFQSKMFDIEIQQKYGAPSQSFGPEGPIAPGTLNIDFGQQPQSSNQPIENVPVIRLRDCRFTSLDFKLNKKNVATQTMNFIARYADDDTFFAAKSGVGQELS